MTGCKKGTFTVFLFFMLLTGCGILDKPFQARDRIAEYAEALFMRQNALTQQLMMHYDETDNWSDEDERVVEEVEMQMFDACQLLNEYANREIEGRKINVFFKRRVKKSFAACDDSIIQLEAILLTMPAL